ncbi:MAG: ATP-binding protein [Pseudomonadales bacterium]|nr:ATP-binding protein [Pseudomonadales bacterium]
MANHPEDLLESLNSAYRLREQAELERKENEVLLSGIRALLETDSQQDIYAKMFEILGQFIPHEQAFVLEQDSPGQMICTTSTNSVLENTHWDVDPVFKRAVLGQPCAVYSIARQPAWTHHIKLMKPAMASALYCPFSGPDVDAILVFCHHEKGFYVQTHVHMAERYREFTQQTLLSVNAKLQALESQQLKLEKERAEQSLIQSEKMASLGLLAAGVAHEINNPIGYVTSNINYLSENLSNLQAMKAQLEDVIAASRAFPDNPLTETIENAAKWMSQSSINETCEDIADLVRDCDQGLTRIKSIVNELRNFARADDDSFEDLDINDCVSSTIRLVSNELKYHCDLIVDLGETASVNANSGKINQVLTNLLVNAGHAIENKGNITVSTGQDQHPDLGNCTWFAVEDNGCGISPENLSRIFEPFYTSKEVGKGTGLGLAISYSIIEKLGGKLEVKSTLNKGTKFTAFIPTIMQNAK